VEQRQQQKQRKLTQARYVAEIRGSDAAHCHRLHHRRLALEFLLVPQWMLPTLQLAEVLAATLLRSPSHRWRLYVQVLHRRAVSFERDGVELGWKAT
jgi:hypothetical protein